MMLCIENAIVFQYVIHMVLHDLSLSLLCNTVHRLQTYACLLYTQFKM